MRATDLRQMHKSTMRTLIRRVLQSNRWDASRDMSSSTIDSITYNTRMRRIRYVRPSYLHGKFRDREMCACVCVSVCLSVNVLCVLLAWCVGKYIVGWTSRSTLGTNMQDVRSQIELGRGSEWCVSMTTIESTLATNGTMRVFWLTRGLPRDPPLYQPRDWMICRSLLGREAFVHSVVIRGW